MSISTLLLTYLQVAVNKLFELKINSNSDKKNIQQEIELFNLVNNNKFIRFTSLYDYFYDMNDITDIQTNINEDQKICSVCITLKNNYKTIRRSHFNQYLWLFKSKSFIFPEFDSNQSLILKEKKKLQLNKYDYSQSDLYDEFKINKHENKIQYTWLYDAFTKFPHKNNIPNNILIFFNDEQLKQKIPEYKSEMRENITYYRDKN